MGSTMSSPMVDLDCSLIRPVTSSIVTGIDWSVVKPIACGRKCDGHFRDLGWCEEAPDRCAADGEGNDALLSIGKVGSFEVDAVDIVSECSVAVVLSEISNSGEQFDGDLDGRGGREQKTEVSSIVLADDTDLPIMPHNVGCLPVGILANHISASRGDSARPTIADDGALATKGLNNRDRAAGGLGA